MSCIYIYEKDQIWKSLKYTDNDFIYEWCFYLWLNYLLNDKRFGFLNIKTSSGRLNIYIYIYVYMCVLYEPSLYPIQGHLCFSSQ